MDTVKTGIIGLGKRGSFYIEHVLPGLPYIEITAVCDIYSDRTAGAADKIKSRTGRRPLVFSDYNELIASPQVEAVLVFSSWDNHFDAAVGAMEQKKAVGVEVGGAYSIEQCHRLCQTYERTKTPFMMLENCCFGERELMVTNMARQGLFGRIVHCDGGYMHDLREEIGRGAEERHYRLEEYLNRNCENYPTHELGPIAKLLNINNGNRFLTLNSVSGMSAGMNAWAERAGRDELRSARFAQGDIFTTIIKCVGGETITLTLDTTLPRYYSRNFTVRGTKGMYEERTDSVFLDGEHNKFEFDWKPQFKNAESYAERWGHPLWQWYKKEGIKTGHGGIDFLCIDAFYSSLIDGLPMPVDVYDAAAMMAVTPLSEQSAASGGLPISFPDFTGGGWKKRRKGHGGKYDLLGE